MSDFINCLIVSEEDLLCNGTEYHLADHKATPEDALFWIYLGIYALLVLGAGLMSGLTIGLLSLDLLSLKVLSDSGTGETKRFAKRLFPIIRQHHWLLVTLLLGNAACVEAMPIFLDRVSDPVTAVLVSVTAVLFFGEVIPQALCTRYGLKIGYYCSPIVYVCMAVMSPIAFPISKLLDCILGTDHETVFKREELKSLVSFHGPETRRQPLSGRMSARSRTSSLVSNATAGAGELTSAGSGDNPSDQHRRSVLTRDEVTIIRGALELTSVTAGDACTPIEKVFMLSDELTLDSNTRQRIMQSAHSRVPVYHGENRGDIRGHLLVKMLLLFESPASPSMQELMTNRKCFREMPFVKSSAQLYDLLRIFQLGKSHMAVVLDNNSSSPDGVRGIITLENVLEKLLLDAIQDEADNLREEFSQSEGHMTLLNSQRQIYSNGFQVNREVNSLSVARPVARALEADGSDSVQVEVKTTRDTERTPLLMDRKIS
ncbi:hypothetical protein BOX15_Mlig009042g1 [Macrostomum lignano]|uniref:CNNM transmembrane domain-containing protein n=1 Tax=Macrostomum lignano TaxID=282301 RepID=A0A267E7I6_9PLAT|nr:hypothetical protein BOX15_Mlig009042g1 [Macrostomum lignano]